MLGISYTIELQQLKHKQFVSMAVLNSFFPIVQGNKYLGIFYGNFLSLS